MKAGLLHVWLASAIAALPVAAHAEWQATEVVKTYTISGMTGLELYESIGKRGPEAKGGKRTIAHTNFKLTWSRKYKTEGDACVLASARPNLIITYTLPKPSAKLAEPLRSNWERFIGGIRDHEQVHGTFIRDLVTSIEAATVGMTVADDKKCVKIKTELTRRLSELFEAYKQRNHDFERDEMSEGGNIHRLILGLVNGG